MKETITIMELTEMYDEMLDDAYDGVFNLTPSTILSECDPIAYRVGLYDFYDSLIYDGYICKEME